MTPRKIETRAATHPVAFYRAIAVTFFCVTVVLLCVIVFTSVKRVTIVIETKAEPVDTTGYVTVTPDGAGNALSGMVSSTVFSFRESFALQGTQTVTGTSEGMVTLHNDTDRLVPLVQKTRLLSVSGALFRLKSRVDIRAHGSARAKVVSDAPGQEGDIRPTKFTIPGLSTEKQKLVYADSDTAFTGGTATIGIFQIADQKKAEQKILSEIQDSAKGHYESNYPGFTGVYTITSSSIVPDQEVGSETTSVLYAVRATVVAVMYHDGDLKRIGSILLQKRSLDDNEVIEPRSGAPTATIDMYDLAQKTARLKIFEDGIATLSPESRQLDKGMFLSKNKDDIRRYVLSLNHVGGVEVIFHPGWMMTSPDMADHITVLVKRTE